MTYQEYIDKKAFIPELCKHEKFLKAEKLIEKRYDKEIEFIEIKDEYYVNIRFKDDDVFNLIQCAYSEVKSEEYFNKIKKERNW